jgi:hypothetical protein
MLFNGIRLTKYILPEPERCQTYPVKQGEFKYETQEANQGFN